MSSATVRPMNCPSESCRTVPTVREISNRPSSFVSLPQTLTLPVLSPR